MKTFSATPKDINKQWLVIDAEGVVLGRLASYVAKVLRGKHKPSFTPHMDCGDNVVIVNAQKIKMTGKKREDKRYYYHTGHPGGIKERSPEFILRSEHPERVVEKAIERMLPKDSPLARKQMGHLYVYGGSDHPHTGQQPKAVDFASMNDKNAR
ncbi:MAG: 50S ribosomal protein L13 [Alphaproteobacteria bacterium]|nr:50S ribosomal protein L13 [Alphaproteobacteria bacterium]